MTVLKQTFHSIRRIKMEQDELFTYVMIITNGEKKQYISANLMVIEFKRKESDLLERTLVNQLSFYEALENKLNEEDVLFGDEFYSITNRYDLKGIVYYNVISGETLSSSEIDIQRSIEFRRLFPVYDECCFDAKTIDERLKILQI